MKIAVCSDLHLEFGPISLENTGSAEVLILSGDICVAKDIMDKDDVGIFDRFDRSERIHTFFQECCERFPQVIYVMGNHEHYHGDFATTINILRDRLGYLHNLHILDKQSTVINGVMFIGGTLWTDMNKEDPMTLLHIKGCMNDFRCVENSERITTYKAQKYKKDNNGEYITTKTGDVVHLVDDGFEFKTRVARFTPEDSVEEHKAMLKFIDACIAEASDDQKIVVIGHHGPSSASINPAYADQVLTNGAYVSDLSNFILDRSNIKLWTQGHTHHTLDYMIGSTRVICNPRGYINYEQRAEDFELLFVDV